MTWNPHVCLPRASATGLMVLGPLLACDASSFEILHVTEVSLYRLLRLITTCKFHGLSAMECGNCCGVCLPPFKDSCTHYIDWI
ncbi:hypothetical protein Sjap_005969 [Stephania japonica]|uniref:Secreted protein n=1 Tax=Stephania japonica TaxID=461633 RepID=A0AAP0PMD3_9MAGN